MLEAPHLSRGSSSAPLSSSAPSSPTSHCCGREDVRQLVLKRWPPLLGQGRGREEAEADSAAAAEAWCKRPSRHAAKAAKAHTPGQGAFERFAASRSTCPVASASPCVEKTRQLAEASRVGEDRRLYIHRQPGAFELRVSKDLLARALRLLQAICAEVERRGRQVDQHADARFRVEAGAHVVIGPRAYLITVEEMTTPIPFTEEDIAKWRKQHYWIESDSPSPQLRRREPAEPSRSSCLTNGMEARLDGLTARKPRLRSV